MELSKREAFFFEWAGYSYDPKRESPEDGRKRGAKLLAEAEEQASEEGLSFEWTTSDMNSSEFSDEQPPWQLWDCLARDSKGHVVASLGAVDFGRGKEPWGDPYRRVVEAELALEALA